MDVLLILALLFPGINCVIYDPVASGVFLVSNATVPYSRAQETCDCYNASLATVNQLKNALPKKFQSCKWGWVMEEQLAMVRAFPIATCANNNTGVINKYVKAASAICYKRDAVKGIFQVKFADKFKFSLMLEDGNEICQSLNATFATESQLMTAYSVGYETCRMGWVKEGKTFLPRHTSNPHCAGGAIGLLQVNSLDGFSDVFCFRKDLVKTNVYAASPASNTKINYTEATNLCSSLGDVLASQVLTLGTNMNELSNGAFTTGWFQNGIAALEDGTPVLQPRMDDANVTGPVYCYDPLALDYIPYMDKVNEVASGVFQASDALVSSKNASDVCSCYNASVANLTQVEAAYDNKFQTCKWGWVQEGTLVMVRLYSNESCENFNIGVLQLPNCGNPIEARVFCTNRNVTKKDIYVIYPDSNISSLTDATNICVKFGYSIASQEEIGSIRLPVGLDGWCQEGIVKIRKNTTQLLCADYTTFNAPVYCYDPLANDYSPQIPKPDTTWRKIAMGCILGGIFFILLFAALMMKGNQFICCVQDKPAMADEMLATDQRYMPQSPTWNTTGYYQPVKEVIDPKYLNPRVSIKSRLPAIRPEMLNYRTHNFYDNLSFIKAEDE
ncbi:uncharacterized protein LOC115079245 [Rhinatrema bivittatum]|uniref:uncharacterized protein LOC115079245 n=1 Tax=Rhinatrema bivittatum TaxID=194408 RepID=UPI00112BF971|nr:uncharacterized protein LOC115079245 [Rhinatrema bivittatum]